MKAADKFQHPKSRVNEMWLTDFIYCKIIGWDWYFLSTILDDALLFTGLEQARAMHKPRLLSGNGPSYISNQLVKYLDEQDMNYTRDKPYRSLKKQIVLDNYYFPGELEDRIRQFVDYYNHDPYHESLNNLTPADVCYDRGWSPILEKYEKIKHYKH